VSLKVTKDSVAQVLKSIRELTKHEVLVGIPADHSERKPDPDETEAANNALIGYVMENGSPARNIPARPHMKAGVESARDEIVRRYEDGGKAILDGRIKDADKVHNAVGLIAENSIKRKITDGPFAPLAPRTLAARKRRGRTGDKPLIDTGQYRRAITHVIRPK
jgi:hypothetical protein